MVFSALLSAASSASATARSKSVSPPKAASVKSTTSHDGRNPEYISDETDLGPQELDAPDLRELNACLEALAVVFPDIQIEVFREMLSNFDGESRLAVVADALLKNKISWVKGRWRAAGISEASKADQPATPSRPGTDLVPKSEAFRSSEYKKAAKNLALHEFRGLSKSTIKAVLAESNYSYLEARRTLVELSSKSWRFTISSLFLRKKPVTHSEAETHPLITWQSTGQGSIVPSIRSTGSTELDRELFSELILPLRNQYRATQEETDRSLAVSMTTAEAEEMNSLHECSCCFSDVPFEQLTSCNTGGHLVCFRCVQHSIKEAVYGQGWQPLINKENGTLRCPAADGQGCKGCIPSDLIHRALLEEKKGADILHKLEQRLAEHSLVSSNLPLVRCPFCNYAEVDDLYITAEEAHLRLRSDNLVVLALLLVVFIAVVVFWPIALLSAVVALALSTSHTFRDYLTENISQSIQRYRRRRRGLKFTCQNADCQRTSCLNCTKEWVDIHVCNESALNALRTQVEQAMSLAIKRVCPRCNTSFVKTTGCNKLTCPCGYKMCYVCRKDIGGTEGPDVGYRHFCEHFRPEGDARPCNKCTKCNLWESENTEKVLRQAKEEAERKWLASENRELSGPEKAFLETGVAVNRSSKWTHGLFKGKWPSMTEFCDFMVENILV